MVNQTSKTRRLEEKVAVLDFNHPFAGKSFTMTLTLLSCEEAEPVGSLAGLAPLRLRRPLCGQGARGSRPHSDREVAIDWSLESTSAVRPEEVHSESLTQVGNVTANLMDMPITLPRGPLEPAVDVGREPPGSREAAPADPPAWTDSVPPTAATDYHAHQAEQRLRRFLNRLADLAGQWIFAMAMRDGGHDSWMAHCIGETSEHLATEPFDALFEDMLPVGAMRTRQQRAREVREEAWRRGCPARMAATLLPPWFPPATRARPRGLRRAAEIGTPPVVLSQPPTADYQFAESVERPRAVGALEPAGGIRTANCKARSAPDLHKQHPASGCQATSTSRYHLGPRNGAMERKRLAVMSQSLLQGLCRAQGLPAGGGKDDHGLRLVGQQQQQGRRRRGAGGAPEAAPRGGVAPAAALQVRDAGLTTVVAASCGASAKRPRGPPGGGEVEAAAALPGDFARPRAVGAGEVAFRLLRCRRCSVLFDVGRAQYSQGAGDFWCPSCRFQAMDPFNEVPADGGVLHCALVDGARVQLALDLPRLGLWREEGESVEARMLLVDSASLHQVWPREVTAEANGRALFHIRPPGPERRRRDLPQNVTAGLRPGQNTLEFRLEDDGLLGGFALALVRVAPRSVRQLCCQVVAARRPQASCRAHLLALRAGGAGAEDGVECLGSDRLKLRCPITLERVREPVRGARCRHLQCFGLRAFCRSNQGMSAFNKRWECPLCGGGVRPCDLEVDSYVEHIGGRSSWPPRRSSCGRTARGAWPRRRIGR
ncbi:unnamed protein product [Prorocentrum cordatum]|uniref:SP-RING-type domain-containing protein n=1 Tax=Prorocentrum cordatum TaxID=2364126 RepID=A0ABN9SUI5_9DINO|nr:unnamed protein product [Polarella glacialis]